MFMTNMNSIATINFQTTDGRADELVAALRAEGLLVIETKSRSLPPGVVERKFDTNATEDRLMTIARYHRIALRGWYTLAGIR
ncbi:MAG TPA: hypothetical protein VLN57_21115 [Xanthobacteraceae bacterium]|nr:hypothetical protein [Xanthobacteraceae bacterium]